MPVETITEERRARPEPAGYAPDDDAPLREWAREHVARVQRVKLHAAAYLVGMLVLTPIWALTQWETSGGFERWSTDHSRPGDWEPWIAYVALIWGLVVAIQALRAYFDRPPAEAEIDRAIEQLRPRR